MGYLEQHIFGKYVNNVKHATLNTDSGTLLNQEITFTSTTHYLGTRYNSSAIQNITLCHQHGCWKHSILFTSHLDVELRNICRGDKASNYIQTIHFYIMLLITSFPLCILVRVCVGMLTEYPKRGDNLGNGSAKEWKIDLREIGSVVRAGFIRIRTHRLTITHFSIVTVLDKNDKHSSIYVNRRTLSSVYHPSVWDVEMTFTLRAHHHYENSKFITSERDD
jgi:hypothetical protein